MSLLSTFANLQAILTLFVVGVMYAQTNTDPAEVVRVGPGVTPPRLIRKVEPEFTNEARSAHIQGTVVLQVVVNRQGQAADISVMSPLGFGLDEEAVAAVKKWEFVPGKKEGTPVNILATVEVNFRFVGRWFDSKTEKQRTAFNIAVQTLNRRDSSQRVVDQAIERILDLSKERYVPALYLAGSWKIDGKHVTQDVAEGLDWILKAAAKNYGPALYDVALRRIEGRQLNRDIDKGLEEMRAAATLGSLNAQFYLGNLYELGKGVPLEIDRARRYYRLCAAQGVALCQYRLARLLYDAPHRQERDYLQAIALFQLAAEQNLVEAKEFADEVSKLTLEQRAWVGTLRRQMVRR